MRFASTLVELFNLVVKSCQLPMRVRIPGSDRTPRTGGVALNPSALLTGPAPVNTRKVLELPDYCRQALANFRGGQATPWEFCRPTLVQSKQSLSRELANIPRHHAVKQMTLPCSSLFCMHAMRITVDSATCGSLICARLAVMG